jgi:hypothetical protein
MMAGNLSVVAMVVVGTLKDVPYDNTAVSIGVVAQGKLIPLLPATLPFDQGPGTIAF